MKIEKYLIECAFQLKDTREQINKGFLKHMDDMNDNQKKQLNSVLFSLDECMGTIAKIFSN